MHKREIIQKGDANGNGLIAKFRLPSGLEIVSLPTKNFYGGHWDLGPTWNYVVLADKPFLVDSGRYGQGRNLIDMMAVAGINPADLDFVLISHSHEDHDGGLAELIELTDLRVKAHSVYDLLIRRYSGLAPPGRKQDFPAKCWHCFMPESFIKDKCLKYHAVLQSLTVETIGDQPETIGPDISTLHVPGHRLYYQDQWNLIHLKPRINELLEHHFQRCAAILEIVASEPKRPDEIAQLHFKPSLLKGPGKMMAANEVISHCELMVASGDLRELTHHQYLATGSNNFDELVRSDQAAN